MTNQDCDIDDALESHEVNTMKPAVAGACCATQAKRRRGPEVDVLVSLKRVVRIQ